MPTILYKYRSLDPWEHLLDILINEKLYAAKFAELNDPMEGMFTYSDTQVSEGFIKELVEQKAQLGICSLSSKWNNTVMWSYYASGHKGIVLGVEVDEDSSKLIEIAKVGYARNISFRGYYGSDPRFDARRILSKKLSGWKHEKEVRIFSSAKSIPIRLRQVYLGCSMPGPKRRIMRQLLKKINPAVEVIHLKRDDLDSNLR